MVTVLKCSDLNLSRFRISQNDILSLLVESIGIKTKKLKQPRSIIQIHHHAILSKFSHRRGFFFSKGGGTIKWTKCPVEVEKKIF